MIEHSITLPGGYRSRDPKDQATHREVVFGRRPTVADQVRVEADSQSALDVQQVLLYARSAVTRFGNLRRLPPTLGVLLQLDEIDREALVEGYVEFMRVSMGERVAEEFTPDSYKLAFGLEVDGEEYDVIEFKADQQPLTGYDEVRLERQHGSGARKDLAVAAREAVAVSQSEGALRVEREISVDLLERLDAYDGAQLLRWFGERRASFRRSRRADG
jgi:hypothetical protein